MLYISEIFVLNFTQKYRPRMHLRASKYPLLPGPSGLGLELRLRLGLGLGLGLRLGLG